MTWMVDLELIVDVLEDDAENGKASAALIDEYSHFGELYISPAAYIQLGPLFGGMRELEDKFLASMGIALANREAHDNTGLVMEAWCRYVRTSGDQVSDIPFTKLMIGAVALGYDGLLTRRPADFKRFFPKLKCIPPAQRKKTTTKRGQA